MTHRKDSLSKILPLLLSIFVDSLGWGVVFPVFAVLTINNATGIFADTTTLLSRNITYELLIGLYCFCMFFGAPFLGSLSDRYGRKKIILLSLIGTAVGFILGAFGVMEKSLLLFFLGRLVAGFTAGNFPIAQAAIADASTEETLPKNLGYMTLVNGIGFACGPVIGAVLLSPTLFHPVNYLLPFIFCTVLILVVVGILMLFYKEDFHGAPGVPLQWRTSFVNIRDAFTLPAVKPYFILLLLFFTAYALFFCNLPIFLEKGFHTSGSTVGYVLTYYAVLFSIGLIFVFPKLTKKYGLSKIAAWSLVVQIVTYALFALSSNFTMAMIILIPIALAVPFTYVAEVSLISEHAGAASQGKMMGVTGSVMAFAWAVGPVLTGYLMKAGAFWVYGLTVCILIASLFLAFSVQRKK